MLANRLEADDEFRELDGIIGTLLRTHDAPLTSSTGRARAAGHPYDPDRLPLFQEVHRILLESLPDGLARAAYRMFVVSEVHPYTDGNGRVARAIMNAALVRGTLV